LPSIGSPKALITRPSQPSEGRTDADEVAIVALAPSRTPSMEAKGRQSALPSRKPTTSTGTCAPPKPLTDRRAPTLIS
jgi:hypothetical protein